MIDNRRGRLFQFLLVLSGAAACLAGCGGGNDNPGAPDGGTPDSGVDPRITMFPTPDRGPEMIAAGPDGNLWVTERGHGLNSVHQIARVTLTGQITEFPLPDGSDAVGITAGPDGAMWFTDFPAQKIGRITTDGAITEFPLPSRAFPESITLGPDGNLWFGENTSSTNLDPTGNIASITTDGAVTEFPVGTPPSQIATGPDGNLWYVAWYHTAIGRMTPDGQTTEFPLPRSSFPHGLVAGPDGNIWIAEVTGVGRLSPSGVHTAFDLPMARADELGQITVGPDGALWFASDGSGVIGRVTTDGVMTEVRPPGYFTPVTGIAFASDGSLWLTDSWNDQIIRFRP